MAEALTLAAGSGSSAADQNRPQTRHIATLAVENMHCGGCIRSVAIHDTRSDTIMRHLRLALRTLFKTPFVTAVSVSGISRSCLGGF